MPNVSVIMPVYKVEPYIHASVDAVLAQTYRDFELLLCDDGSPDLSGQICDEYALKNTEAIVIHKKNGGLSSARNAGLGIATGNYVEFADSDDTVSEKTLETVWNRISETNCDVCIFGMRTDLSVDGEIRSSNPGSYESGEWKTQKEVFAAFPHLCETSMWNFSVDRLYKRKILDENKIRFQSDYDRYGEDIMFLLDLFPHVQSVAATDASLYYYVLRGNQSMTQAFRPLLYQKYDEILCKKLQVATECGCLDAFVPYLEKQYALNTLWCLEQLFHKKCALSLGEKKRYLKTILSSDSACARFRPAALSRVSHDAEFKDLSPLVRRLLQATLERKKSASYFWMTATHCYVKIRTK